MNAQSAVGKPIDRVDGRLKVTGRAQYSAEYELPRLAHAVIVGATIDSGTIRAIDTSAAEKASGVLAVLTHQNAPKLAPQAPRERPPVDPEIGEPLSPLQDDRVLSNGQPIGVVVAETLEQATRAARLVRAEYRAQEGVRVFADAAARARPPEESKHEGRHERGDLEKALASVQVRIDARYSIAAEHHNPMEPHATIAQWDGPRLTLYDKTQWVGNVQHQVARAFRMRVDDVRVISKFVGGAFGSGLRAWPHVLIAALAAREVGRPVKLVLTRSQMFAMTGYRPETVQDISLGATKDGRLTAIRHESTSQTSTYEEYTESQPDATRMFYACPNVLTQYRLAKMNVNTPAPMRAPGIASGMYALESAMDELAGALSMDPLDLRIINHADSDPESELPWSTKSLKECYQSAAERFGWKKRDAEPRSMREGRDLVGYGMASATWPTHRSPAGVRARLATDGTAVFQTATSDIGPGTYTAMTQIAAGALGVSFDRVRFELGDSTMPKAPAEGGSMTVASVGSAVHAAGRELRARLLKLAIDDARSPLHKIAPEEVEGRDGRFFAAADHSRAILYGDILAAQGKESVEVVQTAKPGSETRKYSMHAFGAHFVEVRVDVELGSIRVARVVSRFAAGRIINPKLASSQAIGGIVGGIGMALGEGTIWDARNARVVNANFADYHIPVNADIPPIDVAFIDEDDRQASLTGAKGLAELSLVGVAAAIGNAVHHATGKRIRELPITLERLL